MKKNFFCCLTFLVAIFFIFGGMKVEAMPVQPDWGNQVITVKGMGAFPPRAVNAAQARMMARRAAVADGYRQLAESIKGVNVESNTTVQDFITQSDVINTKINAVIQGARVIAEQIIPDGGYEVTMQVPLFGVTNSVASAVITPPPAPVPFPAPEVIPSVPADSNTGGVTSYTVVGGGENSPMAASGGYTGLIIDCRGLGLNPVMSPVVKNSSGVKLYGHENLNYDLIIQEGMAAYANSQSQASRAGSNPLVIKAERLDDHNANPVVSVADGNRILIENGASGFLNKTAVVFLY